MCVTYAVVMANQRRGMWLAVAVMVGVGALCGTGCKLFKKKPGDSCSGNEASCSDKGTMLSCKDGKFVAMACKGGNGCSDKVTGVQRAGRRTTTTYAVTCDFTGNEANTDCTADDDSAMCAADKSAMIMCKKGKIERHLCRGPKACAETTNEVNCDTSVQVAGEACDDKDVACTPDKKQRLECRDKKLVVEMNCRGPKGCGITPDRKIECDRGGQNMGDPCGDDGDYACMPDQKGVVKCAKHVWAKDEMCTGKRKCVQEGSSLGCK